MLHVLCNICLNSNRNIRRVEFSEAELGLLGGRQHSEIDITESFAGRRMSSTTGFTTDEIRDIHSLVSAAWVRVCGIVFVLVLGLVALMSMVTLMKKCGIWHGCCSVPMVLFFGL